MAKKNLFYFLLILFTIITCYLVLVLGNAFLHRAYIQKASNYNEDALNTEAQRYLDEDKVQIENALKDGYIPVLPPVFFDYPKRIKSLQNLVEINKFIPLGAQPNTKVYYCNEGYGLIKYNSDRYGFRNPDYLWDDMESTDVLLIGDSFVHGACVEEANTFRSHISKTYPITINLGMSGSGPNNYLRTAEYFVEKTKPKKVIIFIFANDNEGRYYSIFNKDFYNNPYHLLKNNNKSNLKNFYNKASNLSQIEKIEPMKMNLFIRLKDDFKLEFIRKLIFNKGGVITDLIDNVVRLCNENSCDPYFVYLPTSQYWRPDSRQDEFKDHIKLYLQDRHDLKNNFFDASEIINDDLSLFAPKGPHYSNEGYELVSSKIIEMIK